MGVVILIDEIGKAQLVLLAVVQGDEKIACRQQLAHDLVDASKQGEQVFSQVRRFRNGMQGGAHRLGSLEFGDVAPDRDP